MEPLTGEKHGMYRGGRYVNQEGYAKVLTNERTPNGRIRYTLEHRVVMEDKLGRKLLPTENVHHINGIKTDNRPENLELWVVTQPSGQRVEDLLEWADEIIRRYRS